LKTEPAKWTRSKRPAERARGRVCATERASETIVIWIFSVISKRSGQQCCGQEKQNSRQNVQRHKNGLQL